jgi:hypothetical protein
MHFTKLAPGKCGLALALAIICMVFAPTVFCQTAVEPRYSLDEAVTLVKDSVGGEVLRAKTIQREGRIVHEIRILTDDGLVRDLLFDAENGLEE